MIAALHLFFRKHVVRLKQRDDFTAGEYRQRIHRVFHIGESAAFSFTHPLVGIAVTVEHHFVLPVLGVGLFDDALDCLVLVGRFLQFIRKFGQYLCHWHIEVGVGCGDGLGGANHAELELVAGEGKGAGTIAV